MSEPSTSPLDPELFSGVALSRNKGLDMIIPLFVGLYISAVIYVSVFTLMDTISSYWPAVAVVALGVVGALVTLRVVRSGKTSCRDTWRDTASKAGLTVGIDESSHLPTMSGEIRDRSTTLELRSKPHGMVTTYDVELSDGWEPFSLARPGSVYFTKTKGMAIGESDIRLYGSNLEATAGRLDRSGVIEAIMELSSHFDEIHIDHGSIEAEKLGAAHSVDELIAEIEMLIDTAILLDRRVRQPEEAAPKSEPQADTETEPEPVQQV